MWITPAHSQVRSIASLTMDFETLFQDLENQLERELDAELINRLEDEERERRAKLTLRERLIALQRADKGLLITAQSQDSRTVKFSVKNVGKDWVALEVVEPHSLAGSVIAPVHALVSIDIPRELIKESLGTAIGEVSDHDLRALSGKQGLAQKVNFAFVLRDLSRRRKQVSIHSMTEVLHGTIDQVGADHIDVTVGGNRRMLQLRRVMFVQIS